MTAEPARDDEFEDFNEAAKNRVPVRTRFQIEAFDRIEALDTEWLARHIVPKRGLLINVGDTGSGKSFLAVDMGLHIAMGRPWAGKAVNGGDVIYIAAEGGGGFRKRLVAAKQHYRPASLVPFYLITDAPDLGHADGDAIVLIDAIREARLRPQLIVLDTLARSMSGADENSSADMSSFVANCGLLEAAFECAILVVHHLGKEASRGARGSSVLKAAADVEITVNGTEGERTATVTKSKDGEAGLSLKFELERVEIDGRNDMSSCVVSITKPWGEGDKSARSRTPKGKNNHLLQIIRNAMTDHGRRADRAEDLPPGVMVVHRDKIRAEAKVSGFVDPDCADNSFRAQLSTALSKLTGDGLIGMRNEQIWLIE